MIESKPDSGVDDLRLAAPWPALATYAASLDLGGVEDQVHSHIPYGKGRLGWAGGWGVQRRGEAAGPARPARGPLHAPGPLH